MEDVKLGSKTLVDLSMWFFVVQESETKIVTLPFWPIVERILSDTSYNDVVSYQAQNTAWPETGYGTKYDRNQSKIFFHHGLLRAAEKQKQLLAAYKQLLHNCYQTTR